MTTPYDYEDNYDQEEYEADLERNDLDAIDCGYDESFPGICRDIGSEHCSFWCPLHKTYFAKGE